MAKKNEKSFENELSVAFMELLRDVDIRNSEKGQGFNLMIPPTMRKLIDQDIDEIHKLIGIKIKVGTYMLLCTMIVSRYGQNDKLGFYRLKSTPSLVDFVRDNQNELKVLWAEMVLKDRRGSR